jgi:hypothetical protein
MLKDLHLRMVQTKLSRQSPDANTYTSAIFEVEKGGVADQDLSPEDQEDTDTVLAQVQSEISTMNEILRSSQKVIARLSQPLPTPGHQPQKFKVDATTRILLDRQKRAYQLQIGQLRGEIRRIQFGKNSPHDPVLDGNYFPFLPRNPMGISSPSLLTGTVGNIQMRATDYFGMNPPNHTARRPSTTRGISHENVTNRDIKLGDRVGVSVSGQMCVGIVKYLGRYDASPSSGTWVLIILSNLFLGWAKIERSWFVLR